ncbi:MAG: hypothetical protein KBG80_09770 [Breznakibacter sp.]|nr:hypothetical protein [Breznakibacter sp.]
MKKIITKHFQYTGTDDYDTAIDIQLNIFFEENKVSSDDIIDIKYCAHDTGGVSTYSALLIYEG